MDITQKLVWTCKHCGGESNDLTGACWTCSIRYMGDLNWHEPKPQP